MSNLLEFIQDNLVVVIVVLAAVVVLVLLMVILKKPKKSVEVIEFRKEPFQEQPLVTEKPQVQKVSVNEVPKETKPTLEVKEVEPNKESETDDEDDPSKDVVSSDKPPRYHVSQNKDEKSPHFKKWRIRKEGSKKTIKFYDTQKEAIEVATDLADKAGTTIVIHKVDGTIRKQDYTKK
ncbi:MAG: DUF2188 domain-containing protein [Acholeplasma sp.]|nr:DUF2188 domain-containing protein [Acholeplasma sp.]